MAKRNGGKDGTMGVPANIADFLTNVPRIPGAGANIGLTELGKEWIEISELDRAMVTKSRRVRLGKAQTSDRTAVRSRAEVADRVTAENLVERQAKIGTVRRTGGPACDSEPSDSDKTNVPDIGLTGCAKAQ